MMKQDYFLILAITSVLLHLLRTNCSLSTDTRYKSATQNTVQTSADETQQIAENAQSKSSGHQPFFVKCELLIQYLQAFNNAIKEIPDTRKGGLSKTFEMIFSHDNQNEADHSFYIMLMLDYEKDTKIVTGKMKAVAAVEKMSLGRKFLKKNQGLDIEHDHAISIVETTLYANWASVVGGYLDNKQKQYISELVQAKTAAAHGLKYVFHHDSTQGQTSRTSLPQAKFDTQLLSQKAGAGYSADDQKQYLNKLKEAGANAEEIAFLTLLPLTSRLAVEGTKIESHIKSIRLLLSEAQTFFDKLVATPKKKLRKPSNKPRMAKGDKAQYFQVDKYDGIFNPAAKLDSDTLLASLEKVFGPECKF